MRRAARSFLLRVKFRGEPREIFRQTLQWHLSHEDRETLVGEVARRRASTMELPRGVAGADYQAGHLRKGWLRVIGRPQAQHQPRPLRMSWVVVRIPRRQAEKMKAEPPVVAPVAEAEAPPHLQ